MKRELQQKIVARLTGDLRLYLKAAKTAHAEATDEQSRAENKYDTRGLEASYLARGQSRQAAEAEAAIGELAAMTPRNFSATDAIDLGALVKLTPASARRGKAESSYYFLAARAGGTEVVHDGHEICVITPQSPLGGQLMGRHAGDMVSIGSGPAGTELRIDSVA